MYPPCLVSTALAVYAKRMEKSVANLQNSLIQTLARAHPAGGGGHARLLLAASQALQQSAAHTRGLDGTPQGTTPSTMQRTTPGTTPGTTQSVQISSNTSTANLSTIQFNLPPALRQLLSQHGHVQQLLPQIALLQAQSVTSSAAGSASTTTSTATSTMNGSAVGSTTATVASAQLLSQLLALLSQQQTTQAGRGNEAVTPHQLRQFVSQWFAIDPPRALTSPSVSAALASASGGALAALMPSLMPALLQWLLVHRSGHSGLAQLLRQSLSAPGVSSAAPSAAASQLAPSVLSSFANVVQGSLQDLRLSQIHLADTSAAEQPEYYMVMPYTSGDKTVALEWLLRKEARKSQQAHSDLWHFSLRFETKRYGPLLIKGSYQPNSQGETKSAGGSQSAGGLSTLRFYLSDTQRQKQADFSATLGYLQQRLVSAGLTDVTHEVHVGIVPPSLAPSASQVQPQRGPYGR